MSDTPPVGLLSAEQLAELRLVVDEERTSHDGTPFAKLGFWPSKVDALLNALAAAEARATEAAAEAGKWQAEAKAHAARCAVLEKADAAPYCEGQCGICDCETAPVAVQPRACSNCQSTDWQELAPGFGCNQCQGL